MRFSPLYLWLVFGCASTAARTPSTPAIAEPQVTAATPTGKSARASEAERFDAIVRDTFFKGFAGDRAALDEGFRLTEAVLKREPYHAPALVWYGAGLMFEAGQAFAVNDSERGMQLWTSAMQEMTRAIELRPDDVAVRIPRGAVMLASYPYIAEMHTRELHRSTGIEDYERALELQAGYFDRLSVHARGELLVALADACADAGDTERAERYYGRIVRELPASAYSVRAQQWQRSRMPPSEPWRCTGCH